MKVVSTFYSRKAAKLAKKNKKMNLVKNLRALTSLFMCAPLRETFSVAVYPG